MPAVAARVLKRVRNSRMALHVELSQKLTILIGTDERAAPAQRFFRTDVDRTSGLTGGELNALNDVFVQAFAPFFEVLQTDLVLALPGLG